MQSGNQAPRSDAVPPVGAEPGAPRRRGRCPHRPTRPDAEPPVGGGVPDAPRASPGWLTGFASGKLHSFRMPGGRWPPLRRMSLPGTYRGGLGSGRPTAVRHRDRGTGDPFPTADVAAGYVSRRPGVGGHYGGTQETVHSALICRSPGGRTGSRGWTKDRYFYFLLFWTDAVELWAALS